MAYTTTKQLSQDLQQCIKECLDCYQICKTTLSYCLQKGGKHAEANHINLLADCAEICQTSAAFMLRNSERHGWVCDVCADICNECARDCEKFDDMTMKECAEACRRCADICKQMAGTVTHRT
ncbi:MAG: four-helix bundle copper-binding protein [Candidatus Jettenia sp.]|uniref:Ferredoxin n=1 Tax=Candidatus Jettenia caeni TaxID=247490 RepID=I3IP19_9BACT|nr:four-helix bundle copper-binding protein [Candidatus Jettenia sp. AMX1]MBC6927612.1 four-helix bundle copper-binding protein [Candidatus Jettenia sp.]NUN24906.1 four-helix bundle copper-binding protein [Candidatus Jettenia caeni]KAA0251586.1 MAG: four-helix bundle copper-binding protein [Candidatus Jettenia sp. AMX1]MCE7881274.1 four-helix bundle copper-binding protein [Candidatus Jettenia sp. AMX1]MCQ3925990.1 four-helix bundle copper-binding protein [Candidatus Jettenia sp.]